MSIQPAVYRLFLALILLGSPWSGVYAAEARVAVASNFTAAMKELAATFEKASAHQLKLSFGSSGKFYAQINQGAPFDVFFSADQTKPLALEQEGLAVSGSRFTYAVGALALWSAQPGWVELQADTLRHGDYRKLALANPRLAPYGIAAVEVLEKLGLKAATQSKWVQGENIAQTYQFVQTANADIGFVALSQIMSKGHVGKGSSWVIPTHLYNPIHQDAVLLKRGQDNRAAIELISFMGSPDAADIMQSYGYRTVLP